MGAVLQAPSEHDRYFGYGIALITLHRLSRSNLLRLFAAVALELGKPGNDTARDDLENPKHDLLLFLRIATVGQAASGRLSLR